MRQRNNRMMCPNLTGNRSGASVKNQRRPPAQCPYDFNIAPANSVLNAGSKRFRRRFLCRKSGGKAFCRIALAAAIQDFFRQVDALQESRSMAGNCLLNPRDFDHVQAAANNHSLHSTTPGATA